MSSGPNVFVSVGAHRCVRPKIHPAPDVFGADTQVRPYRNALTRVKTRSHLQKCVHAYKNAFTRAETHSHGQKIRLHGQWMCPRGRNAFLRAGTHSHGQECVARAKMHLRAKMCLDVRNRSCGQRCVLECRNVLLWTKMRGYAQKCVSVEA